MNSRYLLLAGLIPLSCTIAACAAPMADEDESTESAAAAIRDGSSANTYREAVLIDGERYGSLGEPCAGVLVAPRVALTAARCVSGMDRFRVRSYNGDALGRWAEIYDSAPGDASRGLALVFLDRAIWLNGYPEIASWPLASDDRVVAVGRARDGEVSSNGLYMSAPVEAVNAASHGYDNHYAVAPVTETGDYGGPVFAENTHVLVAVSDGTGDGASLLARVDLARNWIRQRVAQYGNGGNQGWPNGPGGGWPGGPGGPGGGWPGGPGGDGHGPGHGPGDGHGPGGGWPGGPGGGGGDGHGPGGHGPGGGGDGHGPGGGGGHGPGGGGDGHGPGGGGHGDGHGPGGGGNGNGDGDHGHHH
ncbi:Hypothetical protein A7982_10924 [Minicystis rosea]|nr:Hypothetical protein A7982_10924 [Minicystis rosea]